MGSQLDSLHLAYVGIGSNVGDRLKFCRTALACLPAPNVLLVKSSSLYEAEPVDYLSQDWFFNAVVYLHTTLSPLALLQHCQEIEKQLGKNVVVPKGPRTIDLDLLFYDNQVIHEPDLTVPHPSALTRRFVIMPMAEIAPNWIPPTSAQTMQIILDAMPESPIVRKVFENDWG